jgi:pyridoxine 4-dehydrogenase
MTDNKIKINATPSTFQIGGDLNVNRLGYGAMRLTGQPGNFGSYSDWEGDQKLLPHGVELERVERL